MKYIVSSFLLAIVLFSSCGTPYSKEIQTVDSLITVMDSTKKILSLLDTGKVNLYVRMGNETLSRIKSFDVVLNKEDAILLDNFAGIHKSFRKSQNKFTRYYHDINVIPQQLEDLRQDLSRNVLDPEAAKNNLEKEQSATLALFELVSGSYSGFTQLEVNFLEKHEKIILLIERIEAENQAAAEKQS